MDLVSDYGLRGFHHDERTDALAMIPFTVVEIRNVFALPKTAVSH
jgi:hypothetical protein